MQEIWKLIDEKIPPIYQISNYGRVRKEIYKDEYAILRLSKSGGYITISIEGKQFRVHTLVAKAFLDNPLNKPYVNHKDGNKQNNSVDNLEWCTPSENTQHAYATGLTKYKPIVCIETGQVFGCTSACAYYLGIPSETIASAVNNNHPCFGNHFKYIDQNEIPHPEDVLYLSGKQITELSKTLTDKSQLLPYFQYNKFH